MAEAGLGPLAPAVARRGGRVAFVLRFADTNLWRAELTGTKPPRALTNTPQLDTSPQIAPNGDIAFRSNRSGTNEVWLLTGGHARKLTAMNGPVTGSARWSPDGKRLVFDSRPSNHGDLFLLPASGGTPQRLTEEPSNEAVPSWSHDGQAIYFASDRTGDWEVFRMPAVGGAAERLTSQGGFAPFASRDGRWIYYAKRTGDGGLWRRRLSEPGAREERVAPLTPNFWGQWALGAKGLFYAVFSVEGAKAIRRLDLASGQTRDVVMLDRMPVQFDSGMAVAPDEAWLCWSQLDAAGSDIYVMDGAR